MQNAEDQYILNIDNFVSYLFYCMVRSVDLSQTDFKNRIN
jgi:hypothetical protein